MLALNLYLHLLSVKNELRSYQFLTIFEVAKQFEIAIVWHETTTAIGLAIFSKEFALQLAFDVFDLLVGIFLNFVTIDFYTYLSQNVDNITSVLVGLLVHISNHVWIKLVN